MDAPQPSALVIVPDNQLSLAIGKKGQNARLAAKLTGMRIDIKSETEVETERHGPQDDPATALRSLPGITPEQVEALEAAGLDSPHAIVAGGREKLQALDSVGEAAETLYAAAEQWVADHPPTPPSAPAPPETATRADTPPETA
jgi:hypothetical protein